MSNVVTLHPARPIVVQKYFAACAHCEVRLEEITSYYDKSKESGAAEHFGAWLCKNCEGYTHGCVQGEELQIGKGSTFYEHGYSLDTPGLAKIVIGPFADKLLDLFEAKTEALRKAGHAAAWQMWHSRELALAEQKCYLPPSGDRIVATGTDIGTIKHRLKKLKLGNGVKLELYGPKVNGKFFFQEDILEKDDWFTTVDRHIGGTNPDTNIGAFLKRLFQEPAPTRRNKTS